MEKWKNLKREALLYHLSFIIFHLSTNGHRLSRRKDVNIEPKVTDWAFAVCVAGANIIAREVNNERFKYYIGIAD